MNAIIRYIKLRLSTWTATEWRSIAFSLVCAYITLGALYWGLGLLLER